MAAIEADQARRARRSRSGAGVQAAKLRQASLQVLRHLYLVLGFAVLALGIQTTVQAGLGVSPWDVLHLGISGRTGLTLGQVSEVVGLVIVVVAWPLGVRPRLATLLNMILIGVFIDLIARTGWVPIPRSMPGAFIQVAVGYLLLGLGSGLYISADLGAGPRDSMMLALTRRTGKSVAVVRTVIEGAALLSGWLLGGPVGWGTVIGVFLVGPATHAALELFGRLSRLPGLRLVIRIGPGAAGGRASPVSEEG